MSVLPHPQSSVSKRELYMVFAGLMLALTLASLDQNIVSTALPRIVSDLGGLAHLSWVVTLVHGHVDHQHAALRQAQRHVWPPKTLLCRDHHISRRVGPVRPGAKHVSAHCVPRPAGSGRGRPRNPCAKPPSATWSSHASGAGIRDCSEAFSPPAAWRVRSSAA